MAANIEYGEKTFDDVSMFGDNTDRYIDYMMCQSLGNTSIVRYKVPENYKANIKGIGISCDFGARLLGGAYTGAQDGAVINVRFGGTIKFEQKFNWTGLSGYIGGSDDYGSENEILIPCYDTEIDAETVIDVRVTGGTNVRRMYYITLTGILDNGTYVYETIKQAVDGTTATNISVYTVPAGRYLLLKQIVISVRQIDIYAGKGYLVYNGLPVMAIDIMQTEVGGVYGLFLPFYGIDIPMSSSLGIRHDSFECGNEIVAASVYADEVSVVTADYPAETDVRDGIAYGSGSYEGNVVLPAEADVKLGVDYGANGTEYEGEYSGGSGNTYPRGRVVNS